MYYIVNLWGEWIMKALVCELCGSNEFVKEDGYFVCQHCHTKYSPEEAKKIMVEGTVDVSGSTVKVDSTEEVQNLYQIARRAKENNNIEDAAKYYDMLLIKQPSSWEAQFYSIYFKAQNGTIGEIESNARSVQNCMPSVLQLINGLTNEDEKIDAVNRVVDDATFVETFLFSAARNSYNNNIKNVTESLVRSYLSRCYATYEALFKIGDTVEEIFAENEQICKLAVKPWKVAISNAQITRHDVEGLDIYVEKIKKYDASYIKPETSSPQTKSGGCYVATAVYGSYDCPEVWTLRRFRDYTLAETWYGRAFVYTYYAISPTLVKWFGKTDWFKNLWKPMLDRMVEDLQNKGVENTPYNDREW